MSEQAGGLPYIYLLNYTVGKGKKKTGPGQTGMHL
jgi:hypothetical protein